MTAYADIRRAVLELINQYSIAGETISPAYNNQSDAVHRIPNLINQALMEIRTGWRPRRAVFRPSEGDGTRLEDGWRAYTLPENCRQILSGGVRILADGRPIPTTLFRITGERTVELPPRKDFLIPYEAYPEQLPADPEDACPLNEDPEVVQAACFYAAAMLVMMEDEFTYAALRNEYESRLTRLRPPVTAESAPVLDVMGFTAGNADGGV